MFWQPYVKRLKSADRDNLVRLYYLNETSGSTIRDHSDYKDSGNVTSVTLNGTEQPNGMNAATFDGINDTIDIDVDNELDGDWTSLTKGTVLVWFKIPNSSIWTDGQTRRIAHLRFSGDDEVDLQKESTSNQLNFQMKSGGANRNNRAIYAGGGPTDWLCGVLRWETDLGGLNDYTELLINGVSKEISTDELGIEDLSKSGVLVAAIGSNSGGASTFFEGDIGVFALWQNVLSTEDIVRLSKI